MFRLNQPENVYSTSRCSLGLAVWSTWLHHDPDVVACRVTHASLSLSACSPPSTASHARCGRSSRTLWSRWCRRQWTAVAMMGRPRHLFKSLMVLVVLGILGTQFYLAFKRSSRPTKPLRSLQIALDLYPQDSTGAEQQLPHYDIHAAEHFVKFEEDMAAQRPFASSGRKEPDGFDEDSVRPARVVSAFQSGGPSLTSALKYPLPEVDMDNVMQTNSREYIHNSDRYQPRLDEDGVVIIVQVHDRPAELLLLIESLRHVRYINETLIVFSHDLIKEDIHQIVSAVDFAPVLQLWYPYSVQLHPHSFPGDSPNDCTRNMSRKQAEYVRCTNRKHPDSFGHYREGKFCQLKHHWLWKLEYVLNEVRALEEFQGNFLRLDEDYYLLPDAIHLIRAVRRLLSSSCPECLMGLLGEREEFSHRIYRRDTNFVITDTWFADLGRGMVFKKLFWETFKKCSAFFCRRDDYNWDLSLQYLAATCLKPGFRVWKPHAGRLFHIGMCNGFHRNNKQCSTETVYEQVKFILKNKSEFFFTPYHEIQMRKGVMFQKVEMPGFNGGWGDLRDHVFCLSLFERTPFQKAVLQNITNA